MSEKGTIWVRVENYDRKFITGCLEAGVDGIYCDETIGEQVEQLGVVTTITPDGDLVPGEDVTTVRIESKEDEEKALAEAGHRFVIVETGDWMVIPLENLIAKGADVIVAVLVGGDAQRRDVTGGVVGRQDLVGRGAVLRECVDDELPLAVDDALDCVALLARAFDFDVCHSVLAHSPHPLNVIR